jgi:enoyl-CoA hydratase/carnithine racemase
MEVIWGIIPDMMGTQLLPRLIGPSKAKRLIFTADTISGEQGLEWGIVDELADDPRAAAHALAERIAGMSRSALVWSKRLVDMADTASLREGLAAEQQALSELRGTDEQKAAVEKRMGELAARKAAKAQA